VIYRSCDFVIEGSYINCLDKESEEVKPKDQGFNKTAEKIVNVINTVSEIGQID
jgi:hypothetical protein